MNRPALNSDLLCCGLRYALTIGLTIARGVSHPRRASHRFRVGLDIALSIGRCAFISALFLPLPAYAAVTISELMYDVSGTDTGREWIEVTNNDAAPVDLSGFKLSEGGTNHGLTLSEGSAVIPQGGFAIVADDVAKFKTDWPSFSGTLFDSSFSLSNTGETLVIKNGALLDEDSVSYSSAQGAGGDGNSLVRSGGIFVPAPPSPGTATNSTPSQEETTPSQQGEASPAPSASSSGGDPTSITVYAGGSRTIVAGAHGTFEGKAYGVSGKPLLGAHFMWNFGNGETREGERVFYAYPNVGTYILILSVSAGDYSATDRAVIDVVPAQVSLRQETDGAISVFNTSARELDVSLWYIRRGEGIFVIPKGTFILPKSGIKLSSSLLANLPQGDAELLYPNGSRAAGGLEEGGEEYKAQGLIEDVPLPTPTKASVIPTVIPVSPKEPPEEEIQQVLGAKTARASQGESVSEEETSLTLWLLATLGIILLGVEAMYFVRRNEGDGGTGYEIIDISDKKE